MVSDFATWLKGIFEQLASWLVNLALLILSWIWSAFIYILDLFGIGDQIKHAANALDSIPDSVWFFMNVAQVKFGLGVVMTAYAVRFFIRRIPGIG